MIDAAARVDPNFPEIGMSAGNLPPPERGMIDAMSRVSPNFPEIGMRAEETRNSPNLLR